MPGPGQYEARADFKSRDDMVRVGVRGTSSFQSNVLRANTASSNARMRSTAKISGGMHSQMASSHGKFMGSMQQGPDIFEDAPEDEIPGPGQYYDSKIHTAFRATPKDVNQQRFGSSVERFRDPNDVKLKADAAGVGPGSYDLVTGLRVSQRSLH